MNIFKKRKPPQLSRSQALNARPMKNEALIWKKGPDGETIIHFPDKKDKLLKFLVKLFPVPQRRRLVLDEIGSFVVDNCDGNTSVKQLVDLLIKKYKLTRKEAETSLFTYLKQLGQRGIIGFEIRKKEK